MNKVRKRTNQKGSGYNKQTVTLLGIRYCVTTGKPPPYNLLENRLTYTPTADMVK